MIKNFILAITTIVVGSLALSSCSVFRTCHVTATLSPPTVAITCDSLLQSLLKNGGVIRFEPVKQTGLVKAPNRQVVEIKARVRK